MSREISWVNPSETPLGGPVRSESGAYYSGRPPQLTSSFTGGFAELTQERAHPGSHRCPDHPLLGPGSLWIQKVRAGWRRFSQQTCPRAQRWLCWAPSNRWSANLKKKKSVLGVALRPKHREETHLPVSCHPSPATTLPRVLAALMGAVASTAHARTS